MARSAFDRATKGVLLTLSDQISCAPCDIVVQFAENLYRMAPCNQRTNIRSPYIMEDSARLQ